MFQSYQITAELISAIVFPEIIVLCHLQEKWIYLYLFSASCEVTDGKWWRRGVHYAISDATGRNCMCQQSGKLRKIWQKLHHNNRNFTCTARGFFLHCLRFSSFLNIGKSGFHKMQGSIFKRNSISKRNCRSGLNFLYFNWKLTRYTCN